MTTVGVLDDEVVICETLVKYLTELGYHVPDYALNYQEAIDLVDRIQPDIMLLDINIRDSLTGIDFARHLREHHHIPLIYISSYSDPRTIESAKGTQPNGYLLKPFTKDDLFVAIEVAINNFSREPAAPKPESRSLISDALFVKHENLYVKVPFEEIVFIKSDGVYLEIHTFDNRYIYRETMKNMMDLLPEEYFFQVHRSYIINTGKITALNHEFVVLGKELIPISKSQRENLLSRINLL